MNKLIPYSHQCVDSSDVSAVRASLKSDFITQGPQVKEFEDAICNYTGAKFCVAVANGTAALHLSVLAAGLKNNDQGITSAITFVATANCLLYAGARPVFADIDYQSVNIAPESILRRINPKAKAIIPVHFAGLPADMADIAGIARKYKLTVIEDACHALGAQYRMGTDWVKVGSCRHSDMAVFSFHPVKSITTAEGGAITTNNRMFYEKILALRSHGIYKDASTRKIGPWYYQMRDLGFNYRLTDIQAALGLSQLKKLDRFISVRTGLAARYNTKLAELKGVLDFPTQSYADKRSAWHLYVVKLNHPKLERKAVFEAMLKANIGVQVHYIPVYQQPYYRRLGYKDKLNTAEKYYQNCISLPLFVGLTNSQQDHVIRTLKQIIRKCL